MQPNHCAGVCKEKCTDDLLQKTPTFLPTTTTNRYDAALAWEKCVKYGPETNNDNRV